MNRTIKENFSRIHFLYNLLGPLKLMFWACSGLFAFQCLWEVVMFASVASFFQSVVDSSGISVETGESSGVLGWVYEQFKVVDKDQRVLVGAVITWLAMLGKSLLKMAISIFRTKFSTLFIYRIRSQIFSTLMRNSISYFDENQKGALIQMVINESRSCYSVLKSVLDVLTYGLMGATYLILMGLISPKLSSIVVVIVLIYISQNIFLSRKIRSLSEIVVEKTRNLTSTADEGVGGIKQIKLFNFYKKIQKDFNAACWKADFSNRKAGLMVEWQSVLSSIFGLVALGALLSLNYYYEIISLAFFGVFIVIIRILMTTITSFNQKFGLLNQSLPALDRIIDFLKSAEEKREKSGNIKTDRFLKHRIEFHDVSLNYGKGEILKNISLKIEKGQKIALVGESGSGKTSMANLLVRLYDPTSGKITVDGIDLCDYSLDFLRENIGVVNQDNIIFNKSIEENILMSHPDAGIEEMKVASKNAFAHEFINEFSDKYATRVGDRGVKLSGGQRQRINIAQMFLKRASVIILDEATSALDSKSERKIQEALDQLEDGCTSLIIAHRLATVKNADNVIVLDHGSIVEQGEWDELMSKKGIFYKMVQDQSFASTS